VSTVKWRKGLVGCSNRERICILHAEKLARAAAFHEWYEHRCAETSSILCDANDLDVRSVEIRWARYRGDLLLILTCRSRSTERVRTYRWRVNVSTTIGEAFDKLVKSALEK
jgi:hypothetical protein